MVPDLQPQDIEAAVEVLRSGMLIQGSQVEELEKNIIRYTGGRHAIAAANGTATLHLSLVALGIGRGDEVIVPAFSYMATANVVELVGATPVFVDIDKRTFNINPALIEQAISPRTRAIIPVHEFGLACDISAIMEIAARHGLFVIEDAACALGATENGKCAGTFGIIGSFSFHPRKAVTSGEGGMMVTDDETLAFRLRVLRNHGIDMRSGKMEFVAAGFNYRMTDFQGALVNSQLKRLPAILDYKNELASVYFEALKDCDALQCPWVPENKRHTWQSFHILLDNRVNRDDLIEKLKKEGVGTNYGAQCMPAQQYYREKYKLDYEKLFPHAWQAYRQGLVLPLYDRLTESHIRKVAATLKKCIA